MKRDIMLISATMFSLLHTSGIAAQTARTGSAASADDLIPREVLFGNPDRAGVRIGPDGRHIAYLAPRDGVLNVWVRPVEGGEARAVTSATDRPIRTYFWAQNSEQIIYAQDRGGDENFRLYAVSLDTGEEIDLTPFDNIQARVQETDRQFPDEILVAMNNRPPHQLHDLYRVNTRTGERTLVYENTDGMIGLITDSDYGIRMGLRMTASGGQEIYTRDDDGWNLFAEISQEDSMTTSPLGFARDGQTFYMLDSRGVDKAALFRLDLSGDETKRTQIAAHDKADLSGAIIDPKTGHPQAVSFEYLKTEWEVIDESIADDLEYLRSVSDGEVSITGRSHDDQVWSVAFIEDDGPVKYYIYNRAAGEATYLFANRDDLDDYTLAKMHPVVIKSRDGLELVSYLTLPPRYSNHDDLRPSHPLPMILLVHGGPWARDSWGYNSLHQWLANRGYAVLSVNYRGSTGFGKAFINASTREWSGKMHDDLIDAVDWAVDRRIADPERVAIMGGSYGGYATLVGLTFTPDVFAAGVDIVGPSHIKTLLDSIPPYWAPIKSMFTSRVGGDDEIEYLDSISPLTKVDDITKPLLIGQGANDPRVKQAESEQIVAAMKEKGIPVTYVLFPDEGHGFAKPNNSMAFFAVTEAFLAQHIGGQYQPIDDDVRNSTAEIRAGADLVPGLDSD